MLVIGITGPTGAGKTTALHELGKLGGFIFDADAVYHQLLNSNLSLQQELETRFGTMTDQQGKFDRKQLGAVVFSDPQALKDLNAIAHRYVGEETQRQLQEAQDLGYSLAGVDAIALLESGGADLCQVTLAIVAPAALRVRRIMAREGISEEYARARVAAQQPDEFYTQGCDYTLVNDCESSEEFAAKAKELLALILRKGAQ